jgi:hypothetical protein
MKNLMLFVGLAFSCCALAADEKDPVVNIYKADTAVISGKLVRYYQSLGSPCIKVQVLKPGGKGAASNSMDFCSISGKSFNTDFSEVVLEKGEFSNNELLFTLTLMSLTQGADITEVCKFKVDGDALSGPSCDTN